MDFWIYWLILIIILVLIEAYTINLVTIWFVASGLVAMFASLFTDNLVIQCSIFVVLGVFLMIITKPILDKYVKPKNTKTNLDRVVGMTGVCTGEIKKNKIGAVKVDGKNWSAIANVEIKIGDEVVVEKIDGVKLIVRKEDE